MEEKKVYGDIPQKGDVYESDFILIGSLLDSSQDKLKAHVLVQGHPHNPPIFVPLSTLDKMIGAYPDIYLELLERASRAVKKPIGMCVDLTTDRYWCVGAEWVRGAFRMTLVGFGKVKNRLLAFEVCEPTRERLEELDGLYGIVNIQTCCLHTQDKGGIIRARKRGVWLNGKRDD